MYYINIADKGVFQKKPTASLLALLGICVGLPHSAALFSLGRAHNDTCVKPDSQRDTVPSK